MFLWYATFCPLDGPVLPSSWSHNADVWKGPTDWRLEGWLDFCLHRTSLVFSISSSNIITWGEWRGAGWYIPSSLSNSDPDSDEVSRLLPSLSACPEAKSELAPSDPSASECHGGLALRFCCVELPPVWEEPNSKDQKTRMTNVLTYELWDTLDSMPPSVPLQDGVFLTSQPLLHEWQ